MASTSAAASGSAASANEAAASDSMRRASPDCAGAGSGAGQAGAVATIEFDGRAGAGQAAGLFKARAGAVQGGAFALAGDDAVVDVVLVETERRRVGAGRASGATRQRRGAKVKLMRGRVVELVCDGANDGAVACGATVGKANDALDGVGGGHFKSTDRPARVKLSALAAIRRSARSRAASKAVWTSTLSAANAKSSTAKPSTAASVAFAMA